MNGAFLVKVVPNGVLPMWHDYGDAGLDLYARHAGEIYGGERQIVELGIRTSFDIAYVALLLGRSGLAAKKGIDILGGVIDSTYRGEWGAILLNTSGNVLRYQAGDKVCQAIFVHCHHPLIVQTDELPPSDRGAGGFGSTGN